MALIATLFFIVVIVLVLFTALYMYQAKQSTNQPGTDRTLTTSELDTIIKTRIAEAQQPLLDQIETLEERLREARQESEDAPPSKRHRVQ
ncbi:MAG: hypothetical protein AAF730_09045 [Bacteroidota bacterium]